jgi:hypothetical protein
MNEDEMGRTCGRSGKRKNTYRVGVEEINYRDSFKGLCIFIHLAVCLTTGSKPLPKPALHIVRSRACSFK